MIFLNLLSTDYKSNFIYASVLSKVRIVVYRALHPHLKWTNFSNINALKYFNFFSTNKILCTDKCVIQNNAQIP